MASGRSDEGAVVREGRAEDLTQALEVFQTVAGEGRWIGAELPLDREWRLASWKRLLEGKRETMLVAEIGDRIVGVASMEWVGAAELGMAILPEYRRRGIGDALVRACVEWAKREGIHKIELKVWPHNEGAIALYERHGFEREGYLKRHYRRRSGELWDCIIMGLQLPDTMSRA